MKVIKVLAPGLFFCLLLQNCSTDPNHSIRVTNESIEAIDSFNIGSVSYGHIASDSTTAYKPVETGTHTISGSFESGYSLSGTTSISGSGAHKWTITVTNYGDMEIVEEYY